MRDFVKLTPIKRGSGRGAPDAAVRVLKATDNPAVGYGDTGLLHMIADELGWPHDCWLTQGRVLDAIDRHNKGQLVKKFYKSPLSGGRFRVFHLPETPA